VGSSDAIAKTLSRFAHPVEGSLRVLLVDDDAVFRRGLRGLLDRDQIEVAGDIWSGDAAVIKTVDARPDVVLLGIRSRETGLDTLIRIRALMPQLPVVVLAASRDPGDVMAAVLAEASGYIVRDASVEEIITALRSAVGGGVYLSPAVMPALLTRVRALVSEAPAVPAANFLSERENEVLALMARGMENAEIASELHITVRTVKAHVSSILDKLGVENRVQAAVIALRAAEQPAPVVAGIVPEAAVPGADGEPARIALAAS